MYTIQSNQRSFDHLNEDFHKYLSLFHKKSIGSDSLLSDSFQSESDSDFVGTQRNPIKSDQIRPDYRRIPMNPDEIRVGFRLKRIRQQHYRIR